MAQAFATSPFEGSEQNIRFALNCIWDINSLAWIKSVGGGGGAVTVADGADVTQGAKADAAWVSGDGTVIAILKKIAAGGTGLTDAQLRATPVPVSGTVTANLAAGVNNIGDVDILTIAAGDNNIGNVDIVTLPALVAGSANIGDVDVLTVPADPFGVNADVGSTTGSMSAKLKFIAATGIPVTALPALVAGTANIGDVDVLTLPALVAGTANIGDVDVLTVPAPLSTTGGGVEATALRVTLASDSTGLVAVGGDTAHDAVDSGKPIKIGGIARQANPTAVAALDRVAATFDDVGRQVAVIGQVRDLMIDQYTQIASSSAETTILTAAASIFHDMTQLVITNATATAVSVTIRDVAAGSARMIIDLAASGGAVLSFPRPVKQATVNTAWTAQLSSAAVTVNFYIQAEKNV